VKVVIINGCSKVTAKGVQAIAKDCTELQELQAENVDCSPELQEFQAERAAGGGGGGGGRTPTQGATVYYQGTSWKVQYINSKGLVDLKPVHGSGEQHYGIDPAVLEGGGGGGDVEAPVGLSALSMERGDDATYSPPTLSEAQGRATAGGGAPEQSAAAAEQGNGGAVKAAVGAVSATASVVHSVASGAFGMLRMSMLGSTVQTPSAPAAPAATATTPGPAPTSEEVTANQSRLGVV
jgi:hypothetical protein